MDPRVQATLEVFGLKASLTTCGGWWLVEDSTGKSKHDCHIKRDANLHDWLTAIDHVLCTDLWLNKVKHG